MIDPLMTSAMLVYQCTVFAVFTALYSAIGFKDNFNLPETKPATTVSLLTSVYFSLATQTTTGFGDIHPKTEFARFLVSIHLLCTWIPMLLVFG